MLNGALLTFVSHQIYSSLESSKSEFIDTYQNPEGYYAF